MKKILLFLTVVMMTLSVTLVSACGKDEGSVPEESVSSASESASQSIRPSRVINSGSSNKSTNPDDSDSDDDSGNTSISVPDDIYAEGDPYTVTQGEQNTGTPADDVIGLINMIGTIDSTNYTKRKQMIDLAQQSYDALASQYKGLVSNYTSLGYARQAYENFVASVSKEAIEMFKEAVAKISDLSVDASFASDIAACESYYGKIGDSFKSQVANEINQLNAAKFAQACSTLPDDANALRLSNVDAVNTLTEMLTQNDAQGQMSAIAGFATLKAKYQACDQKVKASTTERTFIANDTNNDGIITPDENAGGGRNEFGKDRDNFFSVPTSNGSDSSVTYSDLKNTNVQIARVVKESSAKFTAPCAGTLKFLCRASSNQTYQVILNGEVIFSKENVNAATQIIVEIPSSGTVEVCTAKAGKERFFAIGFSYPNLPQ